MANPNIATATNIYGRTICHAVTTGNVNVTGGVPTNRIYKVNSVIISNVDGTSAADVSVTLFDASTSTGYSLAKTISVPADATLVVISKDTQVYLEEGDAIFVLASANSALNAIISFEEIYA
jgi:hypothetical protein